MLEVHPSRWTCVEHALDMPRKGIYMGENGTSELRIVNKVYDDSVRSVFRRTKQEVKVEEDVNEEEVEEEPSYPVKELTYYTSDEEPLDDAEKIEIIKRQDT